MPSIFYICTSVLLIIIFFAAYLQIRRNRFLSVKKLEELKIKNDPESREEFEKLCPVCGFPFFKQFGFKPWEDDSPSDEICPGCGVQFGYQDNEGDRSKRDEIYTMLRRQFLKKGKTYKNLMERQKMKFEKSKNH